MDGVVYYNAGSKCLVRLAVSVATLVDHYRGPVTILSEHDSFDACACIAKHFGVNVLRVEFDSDRDKNWVLLNKCRLHEKTPYDRTVFIDSDTVILQDISFAFCHLDGTEFIVPQFADWLTSGKRYRKRIDSWKGLLSDEVLLKAFDEPKSVNTGFFGWCKGAKIFNTWYETAKINRYGFIPDEVGCQIILPQYAYKVISSDYNASCKYGELTENAKMVHYHGRKHCRIQDGEYINHSDLWYKEFDKIKHLPFVIDNVQHDRMLVKNMGTR